MAEVRRESRDEREQVGHSQALVGLEAVKNNEDMDAEKRTAAYDLNEFSEYSGGRTDRRSSTDYPMNGHASASITATVTATATATANANATSGSSMLNALRSLRLLAMTDASACHRCGCHQSVAEFAAWAMSRHRRCERVPKF